MIPANRSAVRNPFVVRNRYAVLSPCAARNRFAALNRCVVRSLPVALRLVLQHTEHWVPPPCCQQWPVEWPGPSVFVAANSALPLQAIDLPCTDHRAASTPTSRVEELQQNDQPNSQRRYWNIARTLTRCVGDFLRVVTPDELCMLLSLVTTDRFCRAENSTIESCGDATSRIR